MGKDRLKNKTQRNKIGRVHTNLLLLAQLTAIALCGTGCAGMGQIADTLRTKNIITGSELWGASIDLGLPLDNGALPTLSLWIGKHNWWYLSIKDAKQLTCAADIIRAGRSNIQLSADESGAKLGQTQE